MKRTDTDCGRHYICNWMKEQRELRREDREISGCLNVDEVYVRKRDEMIEKLEKVSREMKRTDGEALTRKMVNVFGRIELDEDETSFLSSGPDCALYEPILRKKAAVDFLAATTKIRWSRMGKPKEEISQLGP